MNNTNDGTKRVTGQVEEVSKNIQLQLRSLADVSEEFRWVLTDEEGSQLFQKFLEQEWSVENILFWKVAVQYRINFPAQSMDAVARYKDICERYIVEDSALCVNLPFQMRRTLTLKLERLEDDPTAISAETLKLAEDEIFNLMMKDPYRRFCIDPAVKDLIQRRAVRPGGSVKEL
eukprot:TRINITY_DN72325_c0_g1_i5.p1 TRINITY_DN72325_c0_g1~~TRINITY_DN72325_c0_g1_i5.p1  ORF type:complete len:184 (+),score=30.88 TRINITY_DN72325_c0_g1_i5:30-554(+)